MGFIRKLPERLLASFESTLAEAREASLLAIVVDISDHEWLAHLKITLELIEKMGAGEIARFYVFNKVDRLETLPSKELLEEVTAGAPWLLASSQDATSVAQLRDSLLASVRKDHQEVSITVAYQASALLNAIYRGCQVLETEPCAGGLRLRVQGSSSVIQGLLKQLKEVV